MSSRLPRESLDILCTQISAEPAMTELQSHSSKRDVLEKHFEMPNCNARNALRGLLSSFDETCSSMKQYLAVSGCSHLHVVHLGAGELRGQSSGIIPANHLHSGPGRIPIMCWFLRSLQTPARHRRPNYGNCRT